MNNKTPKSSKIAFRFVFDGGELKSRHFTPAATVSMMNSEKECIFGMQEKNKARRTWGRGHWHSTF